MKISHIDRYKVFSFPEINTQHGFIGSTIDFGGDSLEKEAKSFNQAFGTKAVLCCKQVHGDGYHLLSSVSDLKNITETSYVKLSDADAIIVYKYFSTDRYAVGIVTADCVPLVLIAGDYYAVVHAGWKGLANGILKIVLDKMFLLSDFKELQVGIGPCAGCEQYEIENDVVSQLSTEAKYKQINAQKYLLDLSGTAKNQIELWSKERLVSVEIFESEICTMTNMDFHSHRRDKGKAGRNLSFIIAGS